MIWSTAYSVAAVILSFQGGILIMNKKFMAKIATSFLAVMLITACSSGGEEEGNNSTNNGSNTEEPASNEGTNNSENSAE